MTNSFVNSAKNESNKTVTENGCASYKSTMSSNVDLFGMIGSVHEEKGCNEALRLFKNAVAEDRDVAIRVLLHSRDIRGGAGRRKVFRHIMKHAATTTTRLLTKVQIEKIINKMIPELGRFDDLAVFFGTKYESTAAKVWVDAIKSGNALAAKWAPRKDNKGAKPLRSVAKMNERDWRKFVVSKTDVVETKMCDNNFSDIDYSHVPSVAMSRYRKAFGRNDFERFSDFIGKVNKGEAKINAGAVYPHDIIRGLSNSRLARESADAQWNALPDDIVGDDTFLPIIDTSGSMGCQVSGSVTALDIAVGLGIYSAERNKSAFKNLWMSFSTRPKFHTINDGDDIYDKAVKIKNDNSWGMSTNIESAFNLILETAVKGGVSQEDMPNKLLIVSDMQFDSCINGRTAFQSLSGKYKKAGYVMPQVVFWQVNARADHTPIKVGDDGTALVSGFSPSILRSVLGGKQIDPVSVMMEAVMKDRYKL